MAKEDTASEGEGELLSLDFERASADFGRCVIFVLGLAIEPAVCLPPIAQKDALPLVQRHGVPIAHSPADFSLEPILEFGLAPRLRPMIARVRVVTPKA